jgi:hypothetical protein
LDAQAKQVEAANTFQALAEEYIKKWEKKGFLPQLLAKAFGCYRDMYLRSEPSQFLQSHQRSY